MEGSNLIEAPRRTESMTEKWMWLWFCLDGKIPTKGWETRPVFIVVCLLCLLNCADYRHNHRHDHIDVITDYADSYKMTPK